MKKFVFIYRGKTTPESMSKEQMKEMMDSWMAWFETFKSKVVDGGNPFGPSAMSVSTKGAEAIPNSMSPATGYTIINVADMSEAVEIAKKCPGLHDVDGRVEVYEAMPM